MSRALTCSTLCVALFAATAPVFAQLPRPERPYRGLFAGGTGDAGQLLTLNASVAAGYDNDLLADATGQNTTLPAAGANQGVLGQAGGSLSYSFQTDRMSFGASASTGGRYYPDKETEFIRSSQGSVSLGVALSSRTRFTLAGGVSRSPYVFQQLFPTAPIDTEVSGAPLPNLDLVVGSLPYTSYDASAGISHQVAQRVSVFASYAYRTSDDPSGGGTFEYQNGGAGISYSVAKGLNLRAGYRYGEAKFADGETRPIHGIDAGVDYSRALSISRRTTLSFGTGSAATHGDDSLQFTVTGSATLNHEFGRTWNLYGTYGRQLLFHETLQEPVLADGVTIGLGGLISRRVQFSAVAQGSLGTVGVEGGAPGFDSAYGTASLSYALTRFMNFGLGYSYYRHRFDDGVVLPLDAPANADRHTVRASVSRWVPLIQRARRNNASR